MSNVTKATFLDYYDQYKASMAEQARLKSAHSTLCKQAKKAGLDLQELKRCFKEANLSLEELELHQEAAARYNYWHGRPVGTQAGFDFGEPESAEDAEA